MKDYIHKRIEGCNSIIESSSVVMEFFGKKKKDGPKQYGVKRYDDKEVKSKIKSIQAEIKKIMKDYKVSNLRLCGNADLYGSYDPKQEYFESNDDFMILRSDMERDEEHKEFKRLSKEIEKIIKKYNIFVLAVDYDKDEAYIFLDLKFANEL